MADDLQPIELSQRVDEESLALIYATEGGAEVELRVEAATFWATQAQMAVMFGVDQSGISRHIANIFADGELTEEIAMQKLHSSKGGNLYNLNMLISVGYRVGGRPGTLFRIWATDKLVRYLAKGFVVDSARLKAPGEQDRIAELRDIVRDIRASEANVYAELRRICALSQDYDPKAQTARDFFTRMQAKLFWAVTSHTPSMILAERAGAAAPNMGLQTWSKAEIRQQDASLRRTISLRPKSWN